MEQIILKGKVFPEIIYRKTGSGPALLLVHGFPANPLLWREIIPELSSRYTLLMPDFFAVPGSWMVDGHNSMDMLAEGFAAILDNEKVECAVIIGHSMGGYMGLAFAGKYPSRLRGLSLVHSSPVPDDEARAEGRRKTVAILESGGKRLFLNKMVKALFPDEFNDKHPEVYKRQTEEAIAVDDQSLVAFYRAIMERADTRSVVQGLSCPVQYLIGEKDSLANIRKELAQESLAKTSFVSIFKNAGHMAMLEEPDAVLAALNRFLSYCLAEGQE